MAAPNTDEMEEFQRLSDRYQPDVEALAGTYDTYRQIKGDGQCGWRGTVFGYFELLAISGDVSLLEVEEIRIRSFKDIMTMAGVDYDLLVDMFDNTWDLFGEIKKAIESNIKDDSVVMRILNDAVISESIVYHFKMMTSSYMALHADDFEPFLEMSLDEYRQTRIDPTNQEIDQIGLQALTTGVIAPAGIGLEVLYLDRSAGDVVTPHAFVQDAQDKPNIRLLYRPGHYDIIYKNNSPLTVMLHWDPEAVRNTTNIEQPGDMYSFVFPYSAYTEAPFRYSDNQESHVDNQHTDSRSHHFHCDPMHNPTEYEQYSIAHPFPLAVSMATTQSYQSSASSDARHEYFSLPQQTSTASSSPPHFPSSSIQPATSSNEPQIRLSTNMFRQVQGHVALPLGPRHVGSYAQAPNSIWHSDFQPEMWKAKKNYKK